MAPTGVYRTIRRRTTDAGIETQIGCHSFRATRITGLYDRRADQVSLDEVGRILI